MLTSNIGAEALSRNEDGDQQAELTEALRKHFRPEFINRIDEIIPFHPLLAEDIRSVLRLEIHALRSRLKEKGIGVRMYQMAYEYLGENGYSREFGARNLRRTVDKFVTTPISHLLLEGGFSRGDMIDVLVEDGKIIFQKGRPHHSTMEAKL